MGVFVVTSNFNRGELSVEMALRDDLEHYHAGLKLATNVLSIPQGGLKRFPGLQYRATLPGKSRLAPFEFNVSQAYIVALSHLLAKIYDPLTGSSVATVATPYTEAELFDSSFPVRWAQQADTMIFVHGSHAPMKLVRDTTGPTDVWTLTAIPLTSIPRFNFEDADTPTITDEEQLLQFTGTWAADDQYRLKLDDKRTGVLKYSNSIQTQIDTIRQGLQDLANTADDDSIVVVHENPADPTDVKGPYRITFTGEDGNKDWPALIPVYRDVAGGGLISITADGDGSSVDGGSGQEPVWSATRGWPRAVTFHEQRLCLAGTPSQPNSVWLSKTEEPFDFNVGTALDDDAIDVTMGADRLDSVIDVVSLRNFITLTSGGEYYSPDSPITPRNVAFRRDSTRGAASVRTVGLDGAVLFMQRDRTALRQMYFTDQENAYVAEDVTILSRHMLAGPSDMDVLQGTLGDFIYVVNDSIEDKSIVVLNTNRAHGVNAWTRRTTRAGDSFVSIAVIPGLQQGGEAWVCVERTIGGATVYMLERFNAGVYLDCAVTRTGSQLETWTGLGHLEGETVMVKLDSGRHFLELQVVGGAVTTGVPANRAEIGFNSCLPSIETMPVSVDMGGRMIFRKKRIGRVTVDMVESRDIYVGLTAADMVTLDPPSYQSEDDEIVDFFPTPELVTAKREQRMLGWHDDPTVKIEQRLPLPFMIRGIEIEVEVP